MEKFYFNAEPDTWDLLSTIPTDRIDETINQALRKFLRPVVPKRELPDLTDFDFLDELTEFRVPAYTEEGTYGFIAYSPDYSICGEGDTIEQAKSDFMMKLCVHRKFQRPVELEGNFQIEWKEKEED